MADLNSIKQALNEGYNTFQNYGLNKTLEQINQNQSNVGAVLGQQKQAGEASINAQEQALLGRLGNVRNDINQRTAGAKQNVGQSIGNALRTFGSTPLNVGQEVDNPAYQGYEPAISQMQNRAMGQVGSVGNQMVQQVGRQEQDVSAEYDDYLQRLEGWRRDKESEAISRYQQQRMAIERERAGSQLEKQLMLANLAVGLQTALGNVKSAYTVAANNGGA